MDNIFYEDIQRNAKYNNIALVLFGSYSRNDYDLKSDIDVLEVTRSKERPYSNQKINYSPYSYSQLKSMAQDGSLFVLHIITEGKVISGNIEILNSLQNCFRKRRNYNTFRDEIRDTAELLDVKENRFLKNSKGYYGLLCYLFRSYLYSVLYDENRLIFSIKAISKEFHDLRILKVFDFKYQSKISFDNFQFCKSIFGFYANLDFENKYIDSVELLRSLKSKTDFGFSIAAHFLQDLADEIYA